MMPVPYLEYVWRRQQETRARVERDGETRAYRDEDEGLRQRDRVAAGPVHRGRGVMLRQGLRRLRLACGASHRCPTSSR